MAATAPKIDYEDFGGVITNMWSDLAVTIHGQIADVYISSGPEEAMRYAWCAEACYWQARGEDKSPSVHEILATKYAPTKEPG
ncbi:MAG TPA: hypothetical protein VHW02_07680 [Rhizomicrobium sp.]|jgi:hypothetical protein|nr:hypothetical protein [Rhizomicrobium sp.]